MRKVRNDFYDDEFTNELRSVKAQKKQLDIRRKQAQWTKVLQRTVEDTKEDDNEVYDT
jgi:hypothetical protein